QRGAPPPPAARPARAAALAKLRGRAERRSPARAARFRPAEPTARAERRARAAETPPAGAPAAEARARPATTARPAAARTPTDAIHEMPPVTLAVAVFPSSTGVHAAPAETGSATLAVMLAGSVKVVVKPVPVPRSSTM